jgi:inorganic pyrophosphatase
MADLLRLPARAGPGTLHVVVESPRGASAKLRWDAGLGAMTLSRSLPLGLVYPYDWGFVPGTRAEDGDPLDALVYWDVQSWPGVVLRCRLVGAVMLEHDRRSDGARVRNDRLLVVPVKHDRGGPASALDLPERVRAELEQFFLHAICFEPKNPRLLGWVGPDEADLLVDAAIRAAGPRARRASPAPRARRSAAGK